MTLDFSQASTTQAGPPTLSFEEVGGALLARGLDAIRYILPGGRMESGEYCIGSLNGERGRSLKVNPKTGRWSDFAGVDRGGDLVSLWAAKHGLSQEEARDEAAAWLGIGGNRTKVQPIHNTASWSAPARIDTDDGEDHSWWKRVKATKEWKYLDAQGRPVATVYRFDRPGEKTYRPFSHATQSWKAPEKDRPLYNLPAILAAAHGTPIIISEGEKCADALTEIGCLATCIMSGAGAADKTDWSPLKGRHLVLWPDRDDAGDQFAAAVSEKTRVAGAASLTLVAVPPGPRDGWDAADATPDERRALVEAALATKPAVETAPPFDPDVWDMTRYQGDPKPRRFLVEGVLPLGKAGLVAAMGDTGKSMMLLDLALSIATCGPSDLVPNNYGAPTALGGRLLECGTAVILSAEDDLDEVHSRLNGIDPEGARRHRMDPRRLRIIPFPNAGGTVPLIQQVRDRLETTDRFTVLRKWFKTLPDLRLIVVDPLAAFVQAALDADNAAAAFTMSVFGAIASETGACLVVAHHMRKPDKPIVTAADARSAVRGATGLVDNGRFTYALWPAPDQQASDVCKRLGIEDKPNTIVRGAIVKSNGPADRTIKLFARDPRSGLLVDRTESEKVRRREHDAELIDALAAKVGACRAGTGRTPFMAYGKGGVVARRDELGEDFVGMGKTKLESLVSQALKAGKIRKDADGYLHAGD